MATHLNEHLRDMQQKIGRFAEREIAPRNLDAFPVELWQRMAQEKLLGLGLPESCGGLGGNYLAILTAGEALVGRGHNMGMVLSWLIHVIVSRFLFWEVGTSAQHETYLGPLASGRISASLAISEPGVGTHPQHLKTSAACHDGHWVLNGEKTLLTNGPFADLFVVIAVSGIETGKKRFTAFIVPKDAPGLSLTDPITLDFFKPSLHCGIRLSNCVVPSSRILGAAGTAYRDMAIPFRDVEDLLLMGPMLGAMEYQQEMLRQGIRNQAIVSTDELKGELGHIQTFIHTLRITAYEAAAMMDSKGNHPELASLLLAFKSVSGQVQTLCQQLIAAYGLKSHPRLETLTNDLVCAVDFAKNIHRIKRKRLGEALLAREE